MLKRTLNRIVEEGMKHSKKYLAVDMRMEGNPSREIIVTPRDSVEGKMKYYNTEFNDILELKIGIYRGRQVRIVDAFMTDDLRDLTAFFF